MTGTPDLRALVERHAVHDMLNRLRVHATGLRENSRYDPAKLSDLTNDDAVSYGGLIAEAADMIQALQHQLAEMEAALEPFAREADRWTSQTPDAAPMRTEVIREAGWDYSFTLGDLRKARSTLKDRGIGRP